MMIDASVNNVDVHATSIIQLFVQIVHVGAVVRPDAVNVPMPVVLDRGFFRGIGPRIIRVLDVIDVRLRARFEASVDVTQRR